MSEYNDNKDYGYYSGGNYNKNDSNMGNQYNPYNKDEKGKKKKSGFLKHLLLGTILCLVFGLAAGAGFFGVKKVFEAVAGKIAIVEEEWEKIEHPDRDHENRKDNDEKNVDKNRESESDSTEETTGEKSEPEIKVQETDGTEATVVTDVTNVVEKVMPAVVQVTNTATIKAQDFFGQVYEQEAASAGSGIIVKETEDELLIVTNYHVIKDADTLKITFIDNNSIEANVKGYDSDKDLAVVAISLSDIPSDTKKNISIAVLGDSDALKVGEPAIAIGNSLGIGQSVTTGVISALNREMNMENTDLDLIQTDAAINPGNSGGALLNIRGEVIGINSNKIGGNAVEGMGYAIPISQARPIIDNLMTKETRTKSKEGEESYLGISGVNVTDAVAQTYNLPKGIYIGKIYEDSPAEKAGLCEGDVIVKFDDVDISTMEELKKKMEYYPAGTTVNVTVMRAGNGSTYDTVTEEVTLGHKEETTN